MKIGYARVSTKEQELASQTDTLTDYGCEKIFTDKASGKNAERPGLREALNYCRKGDTLVITRLDRLGRSVKDLIDIVEGLQQREIEFTSLHETIDTSSPSGKFTFHLFAALAEFQRGLISNRTKEGLEAARARGRSGGRPKSLTQIQIEQITALYNARTIPVKEICQQYKISRKTLYNYINKEK